MGMRKSSAEEEKINILVGGGAEFVYDRMTEEGLGELPAGSPSAFSTTNCTFIVFQIRRFGS
jgi:hypothetical protein